MAFTPYTDGNDLLASQLTSDFNQCANLFTTSTQTFLGPIVAPNITGAPTNNVKIITASGGYTVLSTDYYIEVAKTVPATTTITLPSLVSGKQLVIKDGAGNANTYPTTISGGTIDGASSVTLNQPYASITLICNGSVWRII